MRTIVLGPPGTGKTTTLLNKVDDYLKNTDPDKIGYFAFTQKAAYHARDEAIKKFNLTEDDLPYFRTLHSLAFRKLGLKKDQVMQPRHYKDLGKKLGFPVLIGLSRKSFLAVGDDKPEDRKSASLAAQSIAISNGADCLRTHDVEETYRSFS